jgi:hypothetical protein
MTYGTSTYAAARLDELHRAGAARRRASRLRPERHERIGLVMTFMRKHTGAARAVGARRIAPAPSAQQR